VKDFLTHPSIACFWFGFNGKKKLRTFLYLSVKRGTLEEIRKGNGNFIVANKEAKNRYGEISDEGKSGRHR